MVEYNILSPPLSHRMLHVKSFNIYSYPEKHALPVFLPFNSMHPINLFPMMFSHPRTSPASIPPFLRDSFHLVGLLPIAIWHNKSVMFAYLILSFVVVCVGGCWGYCCDDENGEGGAIKCGIYFCVHEAQNILAIPEMEHNRNYHLIL